MDEYTQTFITMNISCIMVLATEETGSFNLIAEGTSSQHSKDLEKCTRSSAVSVPRDE
jgi:hypothetical protein